MGPRTIGAPTILEPRSARSWRATSVVIFPDCKRLVIQRVSWKTGDIFSGRIFLLVLGACGSFLGVAQVHVLVQKKTLIFSRFQRFTPTFTYTAGYNVRNAWPSIANHSWFCSASPLPREVWQLDSCFRWAIDGLLSLKSYLEDRGWYKFRTIS